MKPRGKLSPEDAQLLAFFRTCASAKPARHAAMYYTAQRNKLGVKHPVTDDAELNVYRQALVLAQEVNQKTRNE